MRALHTILSKKCTLCDMLRCAGYDANMRRFGRANLIRGTYERLLGGSLAAIADRRAYDFFFFARARASCVYGFHYKRTL